MHKTLQDFKLRAGRFEVFNTLPLERDFDRANSVFSQWYSFSKMMPKFLTKAASLMNDNHLMSSLVETAWEELGEGKKHMVHSHLFYLSGDSVGLRLDPQFDVNEPLEFLSENPEDLEILGYAFGLEVIANENIDYLYKSMSYCEEAKKTLFKDMFFKLHFVNEDRHIEMNFQNFSCFCKTPEDEVQFLTGFDKALLFWKNFWKNAVANMTLERLCLQ